MSHLRALSGGITERLTCKNGSGLATCTVVFHRLIHVVFGAWPWRLAHAHQWSVWLASIESSNIQFPVLSDTVPRSIHFISVLAFLNRCPCSCLISHFPADWTGVCCACDRASCIPGCASTPTVFIHGKVNLSPFPINWRETDFLFFFQTIITQICWQKQPPGGYKTESSHKIIEEPEPKQPRSGQEFFVCLFRDNQQIKVSVTITCGRTWINWQLRNVLQKSDRNIHLR